jgi:hypothetical protein
MAQRLSKPGMSRLQGDAHSILRGYSFADTFRRITAGYTLFRLGNVDTDNVDKILHEMKNVNYHRKPFKKNCANEIA